MRGAGINPDMGRFKSLCGAYDLAIVTAEVPCDLETPISAMIKLRGAGPCFLLESAERGETWGRYSILGFDPATMASSVGGRLLLSSGAVEREVPGNPVRSLFEYVEGSRVFIPREELPFSGGAVGYFGYDLLPCLEKVNLSGPGTGLPEMLFMFPRRILVFDHLRARLHAAVMTEVPRLASEGDRRYLEAVAELEGVLERLSEPLASGLGGTEAPVAGADFDSVKSNVATERFYDMVRRARDYIFAGDAFQVVVSQRFSLKFDGDPLSIYRALRSENPSPYMFYLELPGVCLVGSSPEPMVTRRGGTALIRPIAGTRPRGETREADERLERELAEDPKEMAEHIMLVDLARNDLGRVCRAGSVKVTSLHEIERYSHVMHMVSQVEGTLRDGAGNFDLLRSSFPAGTVSGAPKVRACQIIDELEPEGRGPYAGAVGYLSYSGDMDTCITIRTVVVRDGVAGVQAGAGIVADSVPSLEWNETRNKARALIRAVRAAGGLGQ